MKRHIIAFASVFVATMAMSAWIPYYLSYSRFQGATDPDRVPSEVSGIAMQPASHVGVPSYLTAAANTPLRTLYDPYLENGKRVTGWQISWLNFFFNILWAATLSQLVVMMTKRRSSGLATTDQKSI